MDCLQSFPGLGVRHLTDRSGLLLNDLKSKAWLNTLQYLPQHWQKLKGAGKEGDYATD